MMLDDATGYYAITRCSFAEGAISEEQADATVRDDAIAPTPSPGYGLQAQSPVAAPLRLQAILHCRQFELSE